MPKLLLAAVCETVLIDQDGVVSLIRLFNRLSIVAEPNTEVPENAVAPKEWAIFAVWQGYPEDIEAEFNQRCELLYPDGKPYQVLIENKFIFQPGKNQQNAGKIMGFPIGQVGEYQLKIWLEREGKIVVASEPAFITVEHIQMDAARTTNPT